MTISSPGIIISGGLTGFAGPWLTSVEVLDPTTGQICSLPSMPHRRSGHTMESLTICGGDAYNASDAIYTTCITLSSSEWETSHTLGEKRGYHSSWVTEEGTMLLGGNYSPNTTEIVKQTEFDAVPGFTLQHDFE